LIVTDCDAVPPLLVAWHVKVTPEVSLVTELGSQPVLDVTALSGSLTFHVTDTLLVYQPLFPSVPVTFGEMSGGVESAGLKCA
jgi:hypothetical protein